MTNITTPSSGELIGTLDPEVDYGEDGFDGTVSKIEQGLVIIERGETRPVLKDAATGMMIRGGSAVTRPSAGLDGTSVMTVKGGGCRSLPAALGEAPPRSSGP